MTTVSRGVSFEVSSEYVKATASQFDRSQNPILYVEAWPDVHFWGARFKDEALIVDAKPYGQVAQANGKSHLITHIKDGTIDLGPYLMVALDSDYDYLLGLNTEIYSSNFVFQTYAYAIENLLWHPNNLVELCKKSSMNNHVPSNIPDVIKAWSKAVYPEFVRVLKHENEKKQLVRNLTQLLTPDLSFDYSSLNINPQISVDTKEFMSKGLTEENVYLFVRGHDFEDAIKRLCKQVVKDLSGEIKQDLQKQHANKAGEKIKEYCKSRKEIDDFIMFQDIDCAFCMPLIKADLQKLKQNYHTN